MTTDKPILSNEAPSLEDRLRALDDAVVAQEPLDDARAKSAWSLLGKEIRYPIGVSASPLTRTAAHVRFWAQRHWNILTYKTTRSSEWLPHPEPNWIYLSVPDTPLEPDQDHDLLTADGDPSTRPVPGRPYSTANSYGVPSPQPADWQADLAAACAAVGDGQLVIASVQGSPEIHRDADSLIADFVEVARLAAKVSPSAIELNLSCPNTLDFPDGRVRPPLCSSNPAVAREVVATIRDELPGTQLVAKLSYMPAPQLGPLVASLATLVDAFSGVNTVPAIVTTPDEKPAFGSSGEDYGSRARAIAGVSGVALQRLARDFVESLALLRRANAWDFEIIAMGGVMTARDAQHLLERGADAVQVVTAALHDFGLAAEISRVPSVVADRQ